MGRRLSCSVFPIRPLAQPHLEACGLRHLAFRVKNVEQAVAFLASFATECEPIRVDELTGKRFTFFRDPDGLPLEFYEVE